MISFIPRSSKQVPDLYLTQTSILKPMNPTWKSFKKCKLYFQCWIDFCLLHLTGQNPQGYFLGIPGDFSSWLPLKCAKPMLTGHVFLRMAINAAQHTCRLRHHIAMSETQGPDHILALPRLHLSVWPPINCMLAMQKDMSLPTTPITDWRFMSLNFLY